MEDTIVNGNPCLPGPIQGWPTNAEPVKLQPATYTLNVVAPAGNQLVQLVTAKRVALPANSITLVPVKLLGHHARAAIHLVAPEQRFWEHLVIPEGLYSHCQGLTTVFKVFVVNKGHQPLLLDAGLPVVGELVKPENRDVQDLQPLPCTLWVRYLSLLTCSSCRQIWNCQIMNS